MLAAESQRKDQLCQELNLLVQQSAHAQIDKLEQLTQKLESLTTGMATAGATVQGDVTGCWDGTNFCPGIMLFAVAMIAIAPCPSAPPNPCAFDGMCLQMRELPCSRHHSVPQCHATAPLRAARYPIQRWRPRRSRSRSRSRRDLHMNWCHEQPLHQQGGRPQRKRWTALGARVSTRRNWRSTIEKRHWQGPGMSVSAPLGDQRLSPNPYRRRLALIARAASLDSISGT